MATQRTYVRASQFFEEQPEKEHDDSSDDDDSSESDYDFEDGFLVPDSQVSSDDEPAQIDDIAFERARAEAAASEAHKLRRKNEALRRKLKAMTQKKRMWRHRAAIAYRMYHTLVKQTETE